MKLHLFSLALITWISQPLANAQTNNPPPFSTPGTYIDAEAVKEWNCSLLQSFQAECREASDADRPKLQTTIQNPMRQQDTVVKCNQVAHLIQSCKSQHEASCRSASEAYNKALQEKGAKCSRFGNCESTGSAQFQRCSSFIGAGNADGLSDEELSSQDLLAECPYFLTEEKESVQKSEKDLNQRVRETEEDIQNLMEQMKDDQEATTKMVAEIQDEITKYEGQARESMSTLDELLGEISKQSGEQVSKARAQLSAVQAEISKKRVAETAKAISEYQQKIMEIQRQCYDYGLKQAGIKADQLKSSGGISARELRLQVDAGGSLGYLRMIANSSFDECQKSRLFSNPAANAKLVYEAQIMSIRDELRSLFRMMSELNKQLGEIPKAASQEKQTAIQAASQQSQTAMMQAMNKKEELQKLLMQAQQSQMEKQMRIAQLQRIQYNQEKQLKVMREELKTVESLNVTTPGRDDFFKATEAYGSYREARISMDRECCTGGDVLPDLVGKFRKEVVCLSSSDREQMGLPEPTSTSERSQAD